MTQKDVHNLNSHSRQQKIEVCDQNLYSHVNKNVQMNKEIHE